jgi:SAM-dependent methyltransferase
MSLARKTRTAFSLLKTRGAVSMLRHAAGLLTESLNERRIGIRTTGAISPQDLGVNDPNCGAYIPTSYEDFGVIMSRVAYTPADVFLDLGSGMGRAVVLAATLPLGRVIGLEISDRLTAVASENVRRVSHKLRAPVELVNADASLYEIPSDVTLIFFNNSFGGKVLDAALSNIRDSLSKNPRALTFILSAPFETTYAFEDIARHPWLAMTSRFPLPSGREGAIYSAGRLNADPSSGNSPRM